MLNFLKKNQSKYSTQKLKKFHFYNSTLVENELSAECFKEASAPSGAFITGQFQFEVSDKTLNKAKYSQGRWKIIDSHGTKEKRLVRYFEKCCEDKA